MNLNANLKHRFVLGFLIAAVIFTFAVRSVFLWRDFVFVYDQGRDALAVQKILSGHLTLVGPTTGLSGVFLGPFYYYFLAILYFIGAGNPIVPAYFFVFFSALAVLPIFYLGKKISGDWAGVLAVLFYAFSFQQWQFSRWLSNPTNLPLVAVIMFICVLRGLETKKKIWYLAVGLLLGVCLQLEAANAVFLIPALVTIFLVEIVLGKIKSERWLVLWSVIGFVLMLAPQFLFELIHKFISTHALLASFESSQRVSMAQSLGARAQLLFDLYARGWFWRAPWREIALFITVAGAAFTALMKRSKLFANQTFRVVLIWFLVPLFFHLIYTGNHGNFWDYYVIAQYIPFYILVASIFVFGTKSLGFIRVLALSLIAYSLIAVVVPNTSEWLALPRPYTERISLSLQLDAIDWLEQEAGGKPFGMWAYTPTAQDEVYRYLFSYRSRYNGILPVEHPESTRLMFLIVEDDPVFKSRREEWIKKWSAIGTIEKQSKFGAVTVFKVIRKL